MCFSNSIKSFQVFMNFVISKPCENGILEDAYSEPHQVSTVECFAKYLVTVKYAFRFYT